MCGSAWYDRSEAMGDSNSDDERFRIGERAPDLVDPETLADEMADAETKHYDGFPEEVDPRRDANVVEFLQRYRVWDDLRRERTPPKVSSGSGGAVVPLRHLADDRMGGEVARIRRLRPK